MIRDHTAETHVLVGMLDSVMPFEEIAVQIDESHFGTSEGRAVYNLFLNCRTFERFSKSMLMSQTKDPAIRAYIEQLNKMSVNQETMKWFIDTLKHTKLRNECINHGRKIIQLAQQENVTPEELIKALHQAAVNSNDGREKEDILLPEKYAEEHKQAYIKRYENPEQCQGLQLVYKSNGVTKGFPQLNDTFMGLRGGDLIMFCAQSGHGKTTLALNLARILSIEQNYVTYYLNMEMSPEELDIRIASMISGVPATEIITGTHQNTIHHHCVIKAFDRIREGKLVLSRTPAANVSKARVLSQIVRKHMKGLDCLIVDYVGRMESERTQGLQEWQQLYYIAEALKSAAVELNIPIIALAQLNEEGMLEGAKKMKNACDGVIFFVPKKENDQKKLEWDIPDPERQKLVNYKMVKYKVRRNDNDSPIWCTFAKKYQLVTEV